MLVSHLMSKEVFKKVGTTTSRDDGTLGTEVSDDSATNDVKTPYWYLKKIKARVAAELLRLVNW